MPVGSEVPSGWGPGSSASRAQVATAAEAEVLAAIRVAGGAATVAELAESLGAHRNTVREHLSALTARGVVERQVVTGGSRGRPAHRYGIVATPAESATLALLGVLMTRIARHSADPDGEANELGRTWAAQLVGEPVGRTSEPVSAAASGADSGGALGANSTVAAGEFDRRRGLVDLLAGVGFEVDADDRARRVRLTACPFVVVAREQPRVVCGVHLGLIEGLVARPVGAAGVRLDAFAEPGACLLTLEDPAGQSVGSRGPAGSAGSTSSASTMRYE